MRRLDIGLFICMKDANVQNKDDCLYFISGCSSCRVRMARCTGRSILLQTRLQIDLFLSHLLIHKKLPFKLVLYNAEGINPKKRLFSGSRVK